MQTQTHLLHTNTLLHTHTNTLLQTHKQALTHTDTGYQKYIKRGCAYILHFKIFNSFVWGVRLLFICLLCKMFVYYPSRVCGGVEGGCLSVYCPHNFVSSSTRPARPDQAHDSKEMQGMKKGKRGEKNILNKAIKDGDISPLIIWPYESIYGLKLKLKFKIPCWGAHREWIQTIDLHSGQVFHDNGKNVSKEEKTEDRF